MPIVQIQRRMMRLGRVRLGEKGPKGEPRKLTTFRFTSASKALLDAVAAEWGGSVQEWKDAPEEGYFEVTTDATELPIIIPPVFSDQDGSPTAPYSQYYETWSAGGCQRRCDGETEVLSGKPCMCDAEKRECKVTTRVSFILPDIPGLGVWGLESHGWNAAVELPGTLEVLLMAAAEQQFIPAVLRIEQRTKKVDGQTRRFIVPVIDLPGVKMTELAGVVGPRAINGPTVAPPKPALPAGAPDPPADTPLENDQPEWGTEHPDTTDFQPPEHIALTERLKELADQLEVAAATEAAIRSNRTKNGGDLDKHVTWLKQQVTRAENSLKAKGSQETLV